MAVGRIERRPLTMGSATGISSTVPTNSTACRQRRQRPVGRRSTGSIKRRTVVAPLRVEEEAAAEAAEEVEAARLSSRSSPRD